MPVFLVVYDLTKQPAEHFSALETQLRSSSDAWQLLRSTWLLSGDAPLTAQQVHDRLTQHLDPTDRFIVLDVTGTAGSVSGMNEEDLNWFIQHTG